MASAQTILFRAIDVVLNRAQNKHKFTGIVAAKDIVYDQDAPDVCKLDVYRHADKEGVKLPTIVNYPGGGFMAGGKKYRSGIASFFVDKLDVCVINVDYHKCEKYRFPQFTRDSLKALAYIKEHADELGVDLDNLYVMGDSAGAQIAAHSVTVVQNAELADALGCVKPDLAFKGALLFCGPYDVTTALSSPSIFGIARSLGNKVLGIKVRKKGALEAYPMLPYLNLLNWVGPDFPPCFIGHTKHDIFCAGQGERLMAELDKREIPYVSYYSTKFWDYHCWYLSLRNRSGKKVLASVVSYMQSRLKGEIPPVEKIVYGKLPKEKKK